MNKFNIIARRIVPVFILCILTALSSCLKEGDESIILETGNPTGIPDDSKAEQNPTIGSPTTYIPNIQFTEEDYNGYPVIRLDMTGISNPQTFDWLKLYGTGGSGKNVQNIWISIDNTPKSILVYNNSDDKESKAIKTDLVFLVDNSGSMGEEADAVARDILTWSSALSNSNLDIRFGCVGYYEDGYIDGAMNLTDAKSLSTYLNRTTGTERTEGFSGSDASNLSKSASSSSYTIPAGEECGTLALFFANDKFSFRTGANRIYVNFTDEPNQPGGNSNFSVETLNSSSSINRWSSAQGTVHTVYSADTTTYSEKLYYKEKPWKMSWYTGGTILKAPSDFSGVSLENLPVTGAMENSYIIRFTNIDQYMDGKYHTVKITILSSDKKVRAEKSFYILFGTKG